jgi:hypothetical protein
MPAQWAKFTLELRSPQRPAFYNVFYFKPGGALTITDPQEYASTLGNEIGEKLIANLAGCLTTDDFEVGGLCVLHAGGQPYTAPYYTGNFGGTIEGDQQPDFVAVVIQKRTLQSGRSGRGRWYVGPVPEPLTDENVLELAGKTAYNLVADDWKAPISVGDDEWVPQLFSHKDNALYQITGTLVVSKLGSIRGRKSKSLI